MDSTEEIINRLTDELPNELGSEYKVVPEYNLASIDDEVHVIAPPDIVIYNSDTNHTTLLEVKGSRLPDNDLPLATAPAIRKIKEANEELNPDLVLVSTSSLTDRLRSQLDSENVKVIELGGQDTLVTDVADAIRNQT